MWLVLACANRIAAVADDQLKCTHLHILQIAIETLAVVLVVVLVVVVAFVSVVGTVVLIGVIVVVMIAVIIVVATVVGRSSRISSGFCFNCYTLMPDVHAAG